MCRIVFSLLVIVFNLSCSGQVFAAESVNHSGFHLEVWQNGQRISPSHRTLIIKRAPFDIRVIMSKPSAFLVNAYFQPLSYRVAGWGYPLTQIIGFTQTGMAEGRFNDHFDIMLRKDAPSYWYYTSQQDSRFNQTRVRDHSIQAIRTIQYIGLPNHHRTTVADYPYDDIYVVVIEKHRDSTIQQRQESSRQRLHLHFN